MHRERFPRAVLVLGQANAKAKVEYWRMERFALPEALVGERNIRTEIEQLLAESERAAWVLERSVKYAAQFMLAKGGRKLEQDKWNAGRWVPGDVSRFVGKNAFEGTPLLIAVYWSTLESRFHELLGSYAIDRDSDYIRCLWLKHVREALRMAWKQYCASVSMGDAWAIRALVKAEKPIENKLRELSSEILKLELQEEPV